MNNLNEFFNVNDVIMVDVRNDGDYQLCKVTKVLKTKLYADQIQNENNRHQALENVKYYGQTTKWYRKYKKEDIIKEVSHSYGCYSFSAKELGLRTYKGKLIDDTYLYKFYDAALGKVVDKCFEKCTDEFILENEKRWGD